MLRRFAESDARGQAVLDAAVDVIITMDEGSRIVAANRAVERVFGYQPEELVGRDVSMLMPEPFSSEHRSYVRSYLASGEAKVIGLGREVVAVRKGGEVFPIELAVSEIVGAEGRLFTGIVRDITARKAAEAALTGTRDELARANRRILEEREKVIQAEKLSSIGLLASGVAHEINNPLSGVMACIKSLREGRVPAGREDEYFATAQEALERMKGIVRSLLDFARQRPTQTSTVAVAQLVGGCLRLAAPAIRKRSIRLDNRLPEEDLMVVGDRSLLMQVVLNVLLNAVHVLGAEGTLEISAEVDGVRTGIRIQDDGPGMSAAVLKRACDPFFTTKEEGQGTGLGLAVSLGIVHAHQGELEIDSEPGRGTRVTIWLPNDGVAVNAENTAS